MSVFKKVLASVGIGATKIDTKLHQSEVTQGGTLTGVVEVQGGDVEQQISEITLLLQTTYVEEINDRKHSSTGLLGKYNVSNSFTILAGEKKEISFSIEIPYTTPVSSGSSKVWLLTNAGIEMAIDPSDKDLLIVQPTTILHSVLTSMTSLGFYLREVETEKGSRRHGNTLPYIQEFEFIPRNGEFRNKFDEIELTPVKHDANSLTLHIQLDRKARGFKSMFDESLGLDETNRRLTIHHNDLATVEQTLATLIRRNTK